MLIDFASENDLELYLKSRDEIMTSELYDRLAAAGLKRQVVSKIWNKDQFRISVFLNIVPKMPSRNVGKYLMNWNVQSS
jgi:hypothetical protein